MTCKQSGQAPIEYAASFYVYETVTFPIQLLDEEGEPSDALIGYEKVVVSLKQGAVQVDVSNPTVVVEDGTVTVRLEQEDTAKFRPGAVMLQVNIYYDNHERDVTVQAAIEALDNLYKQVMP